MRAHDPDAIVAGLAEMEFSSIAPFNHGDVGVFWSTGGTSPWERHPDTDEFLAVLDGEIELTVLFDDGPKATVVRKGSFFIVPQGHWHRQEIRGSVRELYLTPGRTEHSEAEDPRV